MNIQLERELRLMETKLWSDLRAVLCLPSGVPPELRLQLLNEVYADEQRADSCREFHSLLKEGITTIHICSGWCPECPILRWCEFAREEFSPEQLEWMLTHGSYPPDSMSVGETC